jgi:hypothetical protein
VTGDYLAPLAQSAGVASASSAAGPEARPLEQVGLTLSLSGTYSQFMAFLTILDLLVRTMAVESLGLSGGTRERQITAQITGRMFFGPVGR